MTDQLIHFDYLNRKSSSMPSYNGPFKTVEMSCGWVDRWRLIAMASGFGWKVMSRIVVRGGFTYTFAKEPPRPA